MPAGGGLHSLPLLPGGHDLVPRVYLRLSPSLVRDKEAKGYTDAQIAGFVRLLCEAGQVDPRGRFRNAKVLRAFMGRQAGLVRIFIERGDLIANPDGSLYVEGWDEWQEGDLTVPERVRRLRSRRVRNDAVNDDENDPDRYTAVNGDRPDVNTDITVTRRPLAETLEQIRKRAEPNG